jgi:hypothetical protein
MISDEELASLALAADPHAPLEPDARPWNASAVYQSSGLPEWYMPIAIAIGRGRGTRIVVVSIIVGFLVINAFGLCITSGFLSFA